MVNLRDLLDDEVGLADRDQHAARLDAARDVDRFALAVGQVDRRSRWEEVDLAGTARLGTVHVGCAHAGTATGRHHSARAANVVRAELTICAASPPSAT